MITVDEIYNQAQQLSYADRQQLFERLRGDIEPPNTFQSEAELEQMLLDGLNSGPGTTITPEYWQEKKKNLAERFSQQAPGT